jgi:ACS family hexuronate transporter-like MFS transporter
VRWLIAAMLFLLSVLNYVDRQALSILATTIQAELHLSDIDYARVGQAFLLCYTLSYLVAGRIVDRLGPRWSETIFVTWWSVANMLTALSTGLASLIVFRGLLGLGESGHYAVAAKSVGQLFPPREKGIAVGMYTMGGTLGAALSAPLVAWLTVRYGWRSAFVLTGAAGLVLAGLWAAIYGFSGRPAAPSAASQPPSLGVIVRWWPLWLILATRLLTDPVWYFYLVWFAKYLQEVRGLTLEQVGSRLWVVFVAADVGCLAAGVLSGGLIRLGVAAYQSRLAVMAAAAVVLGTSFLLPRVEVAWGALALASLFAFAVMLFMTSCVTLPLDLFPARALGSAQGLIGMGGSIGGFISTGLVGWVVTYWSYDALFVAMSVLHPAAILLLVLLLPLTLSCLPSQSPLTKESSPA